MSSGRPVEGPPTLDLVRSGAQRRARSCRRLTASTDATALRRSRARLSLGAGRLTICSERHGHTHTHTVAVFGELDLATSAGIEAELIAVEATDARLIVLDLSGLTFMDSAGVHLIARAAARCRAATIRLRLLPGPRHIQRVLTLAGAATLPFAA